MQTRLFALAPRVRVTNQLSASARVSTNILLVSGPSFGQSGFQIFENSGTTQFYVGKRVYTVHQYGHKNLVMLPVSHF